MLCFLVTLREGMFRTFSISADNLITVESGIIERGYSLAEVESIQVHTPEELGE